MTFETIFNKYDKSISFNINGKIYKEEEVNLKEIGFDEYIEKIKKKYISFYKDNINDYNFYKLKKILFNAKILYSLYINYITYNNKNAKIFNDELNEIINLKEYDIIKEELYIIKFFFVYTYINHFYKIKN